MGLPTSWALLFRAIGLVYRWTIRPVLIVAGVKFKPGKIQNETDDVSSASIGFSQKGDIVRENAPKSVVGNGKMETKYLRDKQGRIVGMLRDAGDRTELLNQAGNTVLGWYDASRDETRDGKGRIIGLGNLLLTLLETD